MSKLFLLTIIVAALIVAGAGIYAVILYRRETRRAQFGRGEENFSEMRHHRRLVM